MPTVGSTVMLDRLGPKRSDAEFLKSKLGDPGARFLVLADLKPVIRANDVNETRHVRMAINTEQNTAVRTRAIENAVQNIVVAAHQGALKRALQFAQSLDCGLRLCRLALLPC